MVDEATPLLKKIPTGVYRKLAEQKLEKLVGMSLSAMPVTPSSQGRSSTANRGDNPRFKRASTTATASTNPQPRSMTPMRRAILLLLNFPDLAQTLPPEQYDFDPDMRGAKLLLKLIAIVDRNPQISIGSMIEQFRESPDWQAINKLIATPYFPDARELTADVATAEFAHCIELLNKKSLPREASKLPVHARTGLLGLKSNSDKAYVEPPEHNPTKVINPPPDYPDSDSAYSDWDITRDNSDWGNAEWKDEGEPDSNE